MIELLITTVLIGIVAAMAVPRFQIAYERLQFRAANRELTSTIKLARSMAITEKAQYGIHVDGTARTVTLFKDAAPGVYAFAAGTDSVLRVDTLPQEFASLGTDVEGNVIFFRANGSADFSGYGNVYAVAVTEDVIGIFINNVLASTGRLHSDAYTY
jgi:Tfp pilus assembly protein FimT